MKFKFCSELFASSPLDLPKRAVFDAAKSRKMKRAFRQIEMRLCLVRRRKFAWLFSARTEQNNSSPNRQQKDARFLLLTQVLQLEQQKRAKSPQRGEQQTASPELTFSRQILSSARLSSFRRSRLAANFARIEISLSICATRFSLRATNCSSIAVAVAASKQSRNVFKSQIIRVLSFFCAFL